MRMKLALQLWVVFSFFGFKGVELQRMAVDKSRIHQEITIGRTFRQRERRLKDYDLNGPGSLSPILERLESCCREWCSLMRRWRDGDVWGWKEKEKARRGRRLISRDTTSSTPKPPFTPFFLTKRLMMFRQISDYIHSLDHLRRLQVLVAQVLIHTHHPLFKFLSNLLNAVIPHLFVDMYF